MSYCLSVIALMFYVPKGGKIRFVELFAICLSIFGSFFLLLILRELNYSRAMVIVTLSILAAFGILSLSLKATLEKPALKVITVLVAVMLVVGVANAIRSGQLMGIPFERLKALSGKGTPTGSVTEHKLIRTSFYKLAATYNRNLLVEQATGGAISIFGDRYLLATGDGDLHALSWNPEKKKLDIVKLPYQVPLNREEFISDSAHNPRKVLAMFFRTADILVQDFGKDFRLFVSHHHWNHENQCFTVRVSAVRGNYSKFVSGGDSPAWETIY